MASSGVSKVVTARTGPKTSSRARRLEGSTFVKTVGSTNHPPLSTRTRLPPMAHVEPAACASAMWPSTLSMWASSIMAPTVVSGTRGSPTTQSRLRSAMRSMSSSRTECWTMSRELALQFWPPFQKIPSQIPVAAASRSSASAMTMTGLLPPHSSSTSLRLESAE